MKPLFVLTTVLLSFGSFAQLRFEPVTVHPENVAPGADFLIKVEDRWNDGCLGEVRADAASDRIDIFAVSNQQPGVACTTALVPFVDLINPRARFQGIFDDVVAIRYFFVNADGSENLRFETELRFSDEPNITAEVETGSWISDGLENSGLFVDQQGAVFSANLADYANSSGAWFYGAGVVEGDVIVASLSRYAYIQCVTTPCDRSAPAQTGSMMAVLEDRNRLIVKYEGILDSAHLESSAFTYRRLDLATASALDGVPSLVGSWVLGVGPGNKTEFSVPSAFGQYDVSLVDREPLGGLDTTRFAARDINRLDDSAEPDFVIECQDARPVDGGLACSIADLPIRDGSCFVYFEYDAAGLREVLGGARCGAEEGAFRMFRVE